MAIYKQPKRLIKGAVLLMILTIMFVLIIMLMATLTVVSTAQTRTYQKFEENQAYFTSRSTIEYFINHILSGSGATDTVHDSNILDPTDPAGTAKMTLGREVEWDIRKLKVANPKTESATDIAAMGLDTSKYNTTDYSFDDNDNEAIKYRLDYSTIPGGGSYSSDTKLTYDVTLPNATSGSNKYGVFSDSGKSVVTVEVLNRWFHKGPAPGGGTSVQYGDRTKDVFKLRITCTSIFLDATSTVVIIYNSDDGTASVSPASDDAITTTGALTSSGAGLVAAGGANTLNPGETLVNASATAGNIFSIGSLKWDSSGSMVFDAGASVYSQKGIVIANAQKITAQDKNSFFYTPGTFDIKSSFEYGDATNPMSIVCDKFTYINTKPKIYGNLYTNTLDFATGGGNLEFGNTGGNTKIYVKDIITQGSGNTFVIDDDTNLIFDTGGVDIYIYGTVNFGGTVYNVVDPTAPNYRGLCIKGGSSGSIQAATGWVDILSYTTTTDTEGRIFRTVTLPAAMPNGSTTLKYKTVQGIYSKYFEDGSFDANGDLVKATGETDNYSLSNIKKLLKTAEKAYGYKDGSGNYTLRVFPTGSSYVSLGASSGILEAKNYGESASNVIDTSAGDVVLQLEPSTTEYAGKIKVIGDNTLYILLPEDPALNPITYKFNNFRLYTDDINTTSSSAIAVKNGTTKAAKIRIFGGVNTTWQVTNNCVLPGYFYMPLSTIDMNSGNNGVPINYTTSGGTTLPTKNYAVVGSVTCAEYKIGSSSGVCFLDQNSGSSSHTPGNPTLNWTVGYYTNKETAGA